MIKNYLAVVLRNQFNLFYRFGYTSIPTEQLIEFDGQINDIVKSKIVDLFSKLTPFEYDEEYVILHLEAHSEIPDSYILFNIKDVISIFPLSQQAKTSIESKFDQRIQLSDPIFENVLDQIELNIHRQEILSAIDALWLLTGMEYNKNEFISAIGVDNILQGIEYRKSGIKSNRIGLGSNYWSYLLAYDRYDYFPKSLLGYFYDAGQVFAHSKGLPSFEGSELYKFLQKINDTNPKIKFTEIKKLLESSDQVKPYITQTSSNGIAQYIVAPIFLWLKDEIRNSDDIAKTKLFIHPSDFKKIGPSFGSVVILLGAFFGFKKFYDAYYDNLELRFFKSVKLTQKQKAPHSPKIKVVPVPSDTNEQIITPQIIPQAELGTIVPDETVISDNSQAIYIAKTHENPNTEFTSHLNTPIPNSATDDANEKLVLVLLQKHGELTIKDLTSKFNYRSNNHYTPENMQSIVLNMEEIEKISGRGTKIKSVKIKNPIDPDAPQLEIFQ